MGPSFAPDKPERPPIPAHVHAGDVVCGVCTGHGKLEAYFFPPVDVAPYHMKLDGEVVTRIGVAPSSTPAQVRGAPHKLALSTHAFQALQPLKFAPRVPCMACHDPGFPHVAMCERCAAVIACRGHALASAGNCLLSTD